jgi:hypothetical protein
LGFGVGFYVGLLRFFGLGEPLELAGGEEGRLGGFVGLHEFLLLGFCGDSVLCFFFENVLCGLGVADVLGSEEHLVELGGDQFGGVVPGIVVLAEGDRGYPRLDVRELPGLLVRRSSEEICEPRVGSILDGR